MEITINDAKLELRFGVRFIRELDKIAGLNAEVRGQKVSLGFGTIKALPALEAYDTAVLSQVIYAAAYDADPRPGEDAIDDYLDTLSVKQLENLFTKVRKEISNSNTVQVSLKNMKA